MAFTPSERVSAADPVTRVIGHVTSNIVLADDAEYNLGGYAEGEYEVEFQHPSLNSQRVGKLLARLDMPARVGNYGATAASVSDTARLSSLRMSSMAFDDTGGTVEDELTVNCSTPHGLKVGQYVTIRIDNDEVKTTVFGGGTWAAAEGTWRVVGIVDADSFEVGPVTALGGAGDEAGDSLDGNVWVDRTAQAKFSKQIQGVSLADGAQGAFPVANATLALSRQDWEGLITLVDRTTGAVLPARLHAGGLVFAPPGADPVTPFANVIPALRDTAANDLVVDNDGGGTVADNTQGLVRHTDGLVYLYNETGATGVYDVIMENSPLIGLDVDGYVCLYSSGNSLRLRNRTGASQTFKLRRVS